MIQNEDNCRQFHRLTVPLKKDAEKNKFHVQLHGRHERNLRQGPPSEKLAFKTLLNTEIRLQIRFSNL